MTNLQEMKVAELIKMAVGSNVKWRTRVDGKDVKMNKQQLIEALSNLQAVEPETVVGTYTMNKIAEAVKNGVLTEKEGLVMDWMLVHGLYAETNFSDVIVEEIAAPLEMKVNTVKGVVGSLVKKGYMWTDRNEGYDIVYLTKKGYFLDDNVEERWDVEEMLF